MRESIRNIKRLLSLRFDMQRDLAGGELWLETLQIGLNGGGLRLRGIGKPEGPFFLRKHIARVGEGAAPVLVQRTAHVIAVGVRLAPCRYRSGPVDYPGAAANR